MDKQKSVLIVDDDQAILQSFKSILQSRGYRVDIAQTGREAIEKSQAEFYNLALLDIKLPDMEGTQLLTKMHGDTPRMMKIMVTGHASLENAVEALNLGASAYVMKPANPENLLKVVEEKLREQEEIEKITQGKVTEWIKTRVRKLEKAHQKRSDPR